MPLYAGVTVEVTNAATDFDGTALTPVQIATATIEITDTSVPPNFYVDGDTVSWDPVRSLWYYLWMPAAPPVPAGTYWAKVIMTGVDGSVSFDFVAIRLRQPRF